MGSPDHPNWNAAHWRQQLAEADRLRARGERKRRIHRWAERITMAAGALLACAAIMHVPAGGGL